MMGVHGNGLTALLWMRPTPRSTVMEFFFPGGFAHDYEYTTRALGMVHYGFWNDKCVPLLLRLLLSPRLRLTHSLPVAYTLACLGTSPAQTCRKWLIQRDSRATRSPSTVRRSRGSSASG